MKHPIVQGEMGLIEKPKEILLDPSKPEPNPSLSSMTRSESRYFYEGACFILSHLEAIRDHQKKLHGEADYGVRYLEAILGNGEPWRTVARAAALSAFIQVDPPMAEKKIPLEQKGMTND